VGGPWLRGASCTHVVRFSPQAEGVANETMTISYTNGDGSMPTQSLVLDLTGTGLNVAPVANAAGVSVPQRTLPADPGTMIVLSGSDPNGDPLTYEILSLPSNGSLDVGAGVIVGNSVVYTPTTWYAGPDSFTFRVSDGSLNSPSATITISVDP
jgi:large repetitive protein